MPLLSPNRAAFDLKLQIQLDGGWTALIHAAVHGRTECVRFLLERGADRDIEDQVRQIHGIFSVSTF